MTSYRKAKRDAFKFYKIWRTQETHCPAFGTKVRISLAGWNHVTGATGNKKRSINDVHRRLLLLPYAKQVIESSSTVQNITRRYGRKYFVLEAMIAVNLNKQLEYRKIRVVLYEDKAGNKVFYSVMDRK